MPQLTVPVSDQDHYIGHLTAPVTLVEYGDYQCATCKLTLPVVKQLLKERGDNLCFVFRHFPFHKKHPLAAPAAQAAEAAAQQNKFWDMHQLLYQNQLEMSDALFPQLAKTLQLNQEQFDADFHSTALANKIDAEFEAGVRSGVNGTPCFYINGVRYDGDPSYDSLKRALVAADKS